MRDEFLPFCRPSIGEREIAAVTDVLRSGWLTSGPRVEAFEEAFAEFVGAPHAVSLSSATAGFHLLLEALGIGAGDDVITPSLSWPSPANMVVHRGARPIFADVDEATLELDPASVERLWSDSTRAVLALHFAGRACDLDSVRRLCEERGAICIEDAAHAVGTEYRGARIGSAPGSNCVFSFHAIKNITTGEGGMITTHDAALAGRLRLARAHGIDRDAWKRCAGVAGGATATGAGAPRLDYDLFEPGWKCNLTDLQAAIGLAQLERVEELEGRRESLAARYEEKLAGIEGLCLPETRAYQTRDSRHLFVLRVDRERTGISRDELRRRLHERRIGTGLHFLATHELDYFRRRYALDGALPVTERVASEILSLPLFPDMSPGDVDDVVQAIAESLR